MPARLADANSAYLRSAEHQPVAWYPWGPEPFERAEREDKPILLDIGAVWCHWCHVMDGESYEDPAIAEMLNRDWICIKVDRDERPDVDARYQRAVQSIVGQGGWPLTAFLLPDGKVFYGGTYFPPDGKHGRPGFATVLTELARVYREDREKVVGQAKMIREHLESREDTGSPAAIDEKVLRSCTDGMARVFDSHNGGFGTQPKFSHPMAYQFLLTRWFDTGESWPREMVDRTLTAMARGGVYDQIGGGFHRYSVDARWIVPHFEKMAYDNSELLKAYVLAGESGETGQAELYSRIITGIVHWVTTVMSDPAGGYFASQDADVGLHDDGDYFTWTPDEVKAVVSEEEFAVLAHRFDIAEKGEMHHNPQKNVLWLSQSPEEIAELLGLERVEVERLLESGIAKLLAARAGRKAPFVDRTLYTAWNAMMSSAILAAGAFLDRPDLEQHALTTLNRFFNEAADPVGGVRHGIGTEVTGILDDQVHLANAAIDAYEATGDRAWLERAGALMDHVWDAYATDDGVLLDRRGTDGGGILDEPIKPIQDAPTPSPNGIAAIAFARLAAHADDEPWGDRQHQLMESVGGALEQLGLHGATLLVAADWSLLPKTHVVVVASPEDLEGRALRRAARIGYRPRKVVTLVEPGSSPEGLPPAVRAAMDATAPRAYVCVGPQCEPPVTSPEQLYQVLRSR